MKGFQKSSDLGNRNPRLSHRGEKINNAVYYTTTGTVIVPKCAIWSAHFTHPGEKKKFEFFFLVGDFPEALHLLAPRSQYRLDQGVHIRGGNSAESTGDILGNLWQIARYLKLKLRFPSLYSDTHSTPIYDTHIQACHEPTTHPQNRPDPQSRYTTDLTHNTGLTRNTDLTHNTDVARTL